MSAKKISRRELLRGLGLAAMGSALAACAPQVVKEAVIVEKPAKFKNQFVGRVDFPGISQQPTGERVGVHATRLTVEERDFLIAFVYGVDLILVEGQIPS